MFPAPTRYGGSPCSHIDWNSIKPSQLRTAAIRAVCNQIIYQNYGTLKRKFRKSLFNSLLSSDFDGTNVIKTVVINTGQHEFIHVVGQFLTEKEDIVSETACSSGRILLLRQTVD